MLKDSSIGFRSGEYGGRYSSMISIKQGIIVNKLNKGTLPMHASHSRRPEEHQCDESGSYS